MGHRSISRRPLSLGVPGSIEPFKGSDKLDELFLNQSSQKLARDEEWAHRIRFLADGACRAATSPSAWTGRKGPPQRPLRRSTRRDEFHRRKMPHPAIN